jgi:hypothetical protein
MQPSRGDPAGRYEMSKTKYTVTNAYGIRGGTTHRTPEAAIKAARRREGDGWYVADTDGNEWTTGDRGQAVMIAKAVHP